MKRQIVWLWKNGDRYLAYDHLYPVYPDGGDPLTLGEPIGYAVVEECRGARLDDERTWLQIHGLAQP